MHLRRPAQAAQWKDASACAESNSAAALKGLALPSSDFATLHASSRFRISSTFPSQVIGSLLVIQESAEQLWSGLVAGGQARWSAV